MPSIDRPINKSHCFIVTLALATLVGFGTSAQKVNEPQNTSTQWSQPYPPFRMVGNVYYVGTYDLASYLIVTAAGNILINTGLAASGSITEENIETLGFNFDDTKILLITQALYDHVAVLAAIKRLTGAKMVADEKDAGVLSDGGSSDYALGKYGVTFAPVQVDDLLQNGDTIKLGSTRIVMLHHPGQTKGSCSYLFDVTDERRTYKVLIANLPTIITSKNFSYIPAYPDIAKDYAYTLGAMKSKSFDLWFLSHASQFALHSKRKADDAYRPDVFADRKGYDKAINDLKKKYLKKLQEKYVSSGTPKLMIELSPTFILATTKFIGVERS